MTQNLIVASERLRPAEIQLLTRELVSSINRHTNAHAEVPEGEARLGERQGHVVLQAN